ncbi:MAG TPA: non-homologous end-joining DNA ligase, partial [Acidimicrobiales bacterium]|nr:non-homologous end-joining DNA ligase [Acidimicrobiales bacterium]
AGFTKADVISYYLHIAPVLLPHLADRPVTFTRYPDGVDAPSFFEKHVKKGAPDWLRTIHVPRNAREEASARGASDGGAAGPGMIEYVAMDDLASLVWAANLAAIELHVPMWRSTDDGRFGPFDTMVFDLDPGPPATVVECCRVAQWLRVELDGHGHTVVCPKTSGSKGLQLYIPLDPPWPADEVRRLAQELAKQMERDRPEVVVAVMRRELRTGKVFIDWGQNHPVKTTIAPYSLRAQPEPTVSTPVTWDEVDACARSGDPRDLRFLAADVLERVDRLGDLFVPLAPRARRRPGRSGGARRPAGPEGRGGSKRR